MPLINITICLISHRHRGRKKKLLFHKARGVKNGKSDSEAGQQDKAVKIYMQFTAKSTMQNWDCSTRQTRECLSIGLLANQMAFFSMAVANI